MADITVVAHSRKSFGGGLPELREILAREGVTDPLWYEVKKSRRAPRCARRAAAKGADVMFVWGGDGTVQRCIDAVAGTETAAPSSRARFRACWRRTSARYSAGSRPSRRRGRMTGGLSGG